MKALTIGKVGNPVQLVEVEVPAEKEGHSLVKLKASALNHRDVWIIKGMYGYYIILASLYLICYQISISIDI
jgi:NADPH:quinone reductase-like Zn-dependent oxidoreductase